MFIMIIKTSNHFALQDYLETKRVAFPRFYFVAPADLLDILSKGSDPQAILRSPSNSYLFLLSVLCVYLMRMALLTCLFFTNSETYRHLPKNFDNLHNLEFRKDVAGNATKTAIGMYSGNNRCLFAYDLRRRFRGLSGLQVL
jgi:dynein heavy chain